MLNSREVAAPGKFAGPSRPKSSEAPVAFPPRQGSGGVLDLVRAWGTLLRQCISKSTQQSRPIATPHARVAAEVVQGRLLQCSQRAIKSKLKMCMCSSCAFAGCVGRYVSWGMPVTPLLTRCPIVSVSVQARCPWFPAALSRRIRTVAPSLPRRTRSCGRGRSKGSRPPWGMPA
jgi:hypothetical protein